MQLGNKMWRPINILDHCDKTRKRKVQFCQWINGCLGQLLNYSKDQSEQVREESLKKWNFPFFRVGGNFDYEKFHIIFLTAKEQFNKG